MMNSLRSIALVLFLFLGATVSGSSILDSPACLDEDGSPVDWYIVYKFPVTGRKAPFKTGFAYAYITSEDVALSQNGAKSTYSNSRGEGELNWTISNKLLSDSDSMVQRTLAIAYKNKNYADKDGLNFILYNDQPPKPPQGHKNTTNSGSRAHAKGVVLMDENSGEGIWLTHSTPHYPPFPGEVLEFPKSSVKNGQTFMCLSFNVDKTAKQIVNHLITMFPAVYESKISDSLKELIPEVEQLSSEKKVRKSKQGVTKLAQVITTSEGQELYVYSKSSKFGDDLYTGWISREIESPLFVETWRNGDGHPLNSSCEAGQFDVNNIEDLHVKDGKQEVSWHYTKDHSKWAISDSKDPGVVCITDINRAMSQFRRGGGAVCIKCSACWSVFSKTIEALEGCPVKPKVHQRGAKQQGDSIDDLADQLSKLSLN